MDQQTLIVLCTVGGTIGGAVGSALAMWVTLKVTIALHGARLREQAGWIRSLRKSRHQHSNDLQRLELRTAMIERDVRIKHD